MMEETGPQIRPAIESLTRAGGRDIFFSKI